MNEALQELGEHILGALSQEVSSAEVVRDELVLHVRRDAIVKVLTFLRDDTNCQFRLLVDVCGVDYPDREHRFEVVYHLLSLRQNQRIRVKLSTDRPGSPGRGESGSGSRSESWPTRRPPVRPWPWTAAA